MGNRQYIGARYVPKFFNNNGSNEWVSGITYEALTIVTYLNNTYTSVKPVPSNVGSPNLATEYWACTANFGGVVSELTERVVECESDITSLETYNQYKPTKVLCIGDSYGMKITNNWTNYLKDYMGLDDNHFVNMCTGSAGFVGNPSVRSFYNQLVQTTDKDTFTHIIVVGGFNDAYDADGNSASRTDVLNAITTFKNYINTNFPNVKKVLMGCPAWVTNDGGLYETITNLRTALLNVKTYYAQGCGENGIGYMKDMEYAIHTKQAMDISDVTYGMVFHPNGVGGQLIAQCINNYINGGDYSLNLFRTEQVTPTSNFTFSTAMFVTSRQNNGEVELEFNNPSVLLSTSLTTITKANQFTPVKFATFDATNFYSSHRGDWFYVECRAVTNNNVSLYGGMCKITILYDGLYLTPQFAEFDGYLTKFYLGQCIYKGNINYN